MRTRSGRQFGNKINDRKGLAWDGESVLAMEQKQEAQRQERSGGYVSPDACLYETVCSQPYYRPDSFQLFVSQLPLTRTCISEISHRPPEHTCLKLKTGPTGFTIRSMEHDRILRIQEPSKQLPALYLKLLR